MLARNEWIEPEDPEPDRTISFPPESRWSGWELRAVCLIPVILFFVYVLYPAVERMQARSVQHEIARLTAGR